MNVSGTVSPTEIQFTGGGSTTINAGAGAAISFYQTNNLTIEDDNGSALATSSVVNDTINCPIDGPGSTSQPLYKTGTGTVAVTTVTAFPAAFTCRAARLWSPPAPSARRRYTPAAQRNWPSRAQQRHLQQHNHHPWRARGEPRART